MLKASKYRGGFRTTRIKPSGKCRISHNELISAKKSESDLICVMSSNAQPPSPTLMPTRIFFLSAVTNEHSVL